MAGNDLKRLKTAGNGWKWLEMTRNGFTSWKWLNIALHG